MVESLADSVMAMQRSSDHLADQRRLCVYYVDQLLWRSGNVSDESWAKAFAWARAQYGKVSLASVYFTGHWREIEEQARGFQHAEDSIAGAIPNPEFAELKRMMMEGSLCR